MVVEDGTGVADADSYVSVGFADNYFAARGMSAWAGLDDAAKEAALVRATDYVDNMFQWRGRKLSAGQALRFPRSGLMDYEGQEVAGVPVALMQSVCDAALAASGGAELFQTESENGAVTSERIGDLSFTYSRTDGGAAKSATLYDSINTRLRGLYVDASERCIRTGRVLR